MTKKSSNKNLRQANKAKKDEFYTQLSDIEKELKYYKDQFKGKVVYCNADDPFESNFFKYFASNFNVLGLKKLIATSYAGSPVAGGQLSFFEIEGLKKAKKKEPMKIEINEVSDLDDNGAVNLSDVEWLLKHDKNVATPLKGDGDFRKDESIEILKEADIVVTNPPFSLFREYMAQLVGYKKNFLIIGNDNANTYKEIFRLRKENKIWSGYNKVKEFRKPDGSVQKFGNVGWFTNLETTKRHEDLILYKTYKGNEEEYPKYDNYNAINVNKVAEIPIDYIGVMGVPIGFLDKYNPKQFQIIDGLNRYTILDIAGLNDNAVSKHLHMTEINGKSTYFRVLIKNKKVTK